MSDTTSTLPRRSISSKAHTAAILWILACTAGFPLGNLVGGENGVQGIAGNLLYGLAFGVLQAAALFFWRRQAHGWILAWPVLSALGFTLGVRLGERLSFLFTSNHTLLGIIFGIFVGVSIGLTQALALRRMSWVPVSILAWVAAESAAFATGFDPRYVPLVGLANGVLTGIGLLLHFNSQRRIDQIKSRALG